MTWAGVGQVIDALRDLQRKSPGAGEIITASGTVRSHRQRMRYREARAAGSPIGSDPTKDAAKHNDRQHPAQAQRPAPGVVRVVRAFSLSGPGANQGALTASGPNGPTDGTTPMPISRPTTIAHPSPGPPDSPEATDQESIVAQTQPYGNHSPTRSGCCEESHDDIIKKSQRSNPYQRDQRKTGRYETDDEWSCVAPWLPPPSQQGVLTPRISVRSVMRPHQCWPQGACDATNDMDTSFIEMMAMGDITNQNRLGSYWPLSDLRHQLAPRPIH